MQAATSELVVNVVVDASRTFACTVMRDVLWSLFDHGMEGGPEKTITVLHMCLIMRFVIPMVFGH
jgi:hypothetical protein